MTVKMLENVPQEVPPVYGHTATLLPDKKTIFIFGGMTPGSVNGDSFLLDTCNISIMPLRTKLFLL
jgi:hypothetical protein